MQTHGFEEILAEHPIFKSFDAPTQALLAGCARNEHFKAGSLIYGEGDAADRAYLLRHGDVAVEIASPERGPLIVETLHAGDMLSWGWMVPPYQHMSEARAVTEVRAVSLDAECLRGKMEANPVLGYQMFAHVLPHMAARVRALRMQLLDLYGAPRT
ncbi:MAG: cyclic nucleotide-binding domain-containing protein [Limimaricola sp.]|uniref:cyclic nucleotide-binding domain-containing protein n=1 Tax=Limimaricola sp. TaxID=2211665 RepID=UPI001DF3C71F|nr:cyclic nucleotide-binding domain-containing protein [Limimaricola sp.]MBI1418148.1 cyclic nucleotide-binding domain-containing protein [Limimaricola sp.]